MIIYASCTECGITREGKEYRKHNEHCSRYDPDWESKQGTDAPMFHPLRFEEMSFEEKFNFIEKQIKKRDISGSIDLNKEIFETYLPWLIVNSRRMYADLQDEFSGYYEEWLDGK